MYNQFYPYMIPNATRMASPLINATRSPLSLLSKSAPTVGALGKTSTITFGSILNGASKTLGVINQAIPVFYQVKPIVNNAKTMFKVAREINTNDKKSTTKVSNTLNTNEVNKPNFFI